MSSKEDFDPFAVLFEEASLSSKKKEPNPSVAGASASGGADAGANEMQANKVKKAGKMQEEATGEEDSDEFEIEVVLKNKDNAQEQRIKDMMTKGIKEAESGEKPTRDSGIAGTNSEVCSEKQAVKAGQEQQVQEDKEEVKESTEGTAVGATPTVEEVEEEKCDGRVGKGSVAIGAIASALSSGAPFQAPSQASGVGGGALEAERAAFQREKEAMSARLAESEAGLQRALREVTALQLEKQRRAEQEEAAARKKLPMPPAPAAATAKVTMGSLLWGGGWPRQSAAGKQQYSKGGQAAEGGKQGQQRAVNPAAVLLRKHHMLQQEHAALHKKALEMQQKLNQLQQQQAATTPAAAGGSEDKAHKPLATASMAGMGGAVASGIASMFGRGKTPATPDSAASAVGGGAVGGGAAGGGAVEGGHIEEHRLASYANSTANQASMTDKVSAAAAAAALDALPAGEGAAAGGDGENGALAGELRKAQAEGRSLMQKLISAGEERRRLLERVKGAEAERDAERVARKSEAEAGARDDQTRLESFKTLLRQTELDKERSSARLRMQVEEVVQSKAELARRLREEAKRAAVEAEERVQAAEAAVEEGRRLKQEANERLKAAEGRLNRLEEETQRQAKRIKGLQREKDKLLDESHMIAAGKDRKCMELYQQVDALREQLAAAAAAGTEAEEMSGRGDEGIGGGDQEWGKDEGGGGGGRHRRAGSDAGLELVKTRRRLQDAQRKQSFAKHEFMKVLEQLAAQRRRAEAAEERLEAGQAALQGRIAFLEALLLNHPQVKGGGGREEEGASSGDEMEALSGRRAISGRGSLVAGPSSAAFCGDTFSERCWESVNEAIQGATARATRLASYLRSVPGFAEASKAAALSAARKRLGRRAPELVGMGGEEEEKEAMGLGRAAGEGDEGGKEGDEGLRPSTPEPQNPLVAAVKEAEALQGEVAVLQRASSGLVGYQRDLAEYLAEAAAAQAAAMESASAATGIKIVCMAMVRQCGAAKATASASRGPRASSRGFGRHSASGGKYERIS